MWITFKIFIVYVTILLLFRFWFFWPKSKWDPQSGIEPTSSALAKS